MTIQLAQRVVEMQESASVAAAQRVRELRSSGVDVVDFTIGEPDFDTPQHVKDAAVAAIAAGVTKYTPVTGLPELRDAILAKARERTGLDYSPHEVTVGGGAKQVIFLALMASVEPGVEVIVPAPYWVSHPEMVRVNGGEPVILPTGAADGFLVRAEALTDAVTPRTRWLILNAPANPSGSVYREADLAAIAAVLREHPHVDVLADEIYDELVFDGTATSLLQVAPDLRERVLVVNGVSKTYAMTGWRIGYATGERTLIAAINKLQSQSSSCPSSISQMAAAAALSGDQSFVAAAVDSYRARRDLICTLLGGVDGLSPVPPSGTFYAMVDCGGLLGRRTPTGQVLATDNDVVLYLVDEAHVATIPGGAYGVSPYFRLSFATSCGRVAASSRTRRREVAWVRQAQVTMCSGSVKIVHKGGSTLPFHKRTLPSARYKVRRTPCRITVRRGRSSHTSRSAREANRSRTAAYCHSVTHRGPPLNSSTRCAKSGCWVHSGPWNSPSISVCGNASSAPRRAASVVFPEPDAPATRIRCGRAGSGSSGPSTRPVCRFAVNSGRHDRREALQTE